VQQVLGSQTVLILSLSKKTRQGKHFAGLVVSIISAHAQAIQHRSNPCSSYLGIMRLDGGYRIPAYTRPWGIVRFKMVCVQLYQPGHKIIALQVLSIRGKAFINNSDDTIPDLYVAERNAICQYKARISQLEVVTLGHIAKALKRQYRLVGPRFRRNVNNPRVIMIVREVMTAWTKKKPALFAELRALCRAWKNRLLHVASFHKFDYRHWRIVTRAHPAFQNTRVTTRPVGETRTQDCEQLTNRRFISNSIKGLTSLRYIILLGAGDHGFDNPTKLLGLWYRRLDRFMFYQ